MTNSPKLISIVGVCTDIGIGKTKAYELINEGRLDVVKIGRRTLVTVQSLERLINESRVRSDTDETC